MSQGVRWRFRMDGKEKNDHFQFESSHADEPVGFEPVSYFNSLLTGKFTGNFARLQVVSGHLVSQVPASQ